MKNNKWSIVFFIALVVGGLLSLFASTFPDGLERVAEVQGFLEKGKQLVAGLMPDYQIPGIYIENLAKSLAGIIGTCMVFALLFVMGKYLYSFNDREKR